ncbi:hypothetical protein P7K49_036960, partial [Saguinus oedipus]
LVTDAKVFASEETAGTPLDQPIALCMKVLSVEPGTTAGPTNARDTQSTPVGAYTVAQPLGPFTWVGMQRELGWAGNETPCAACAWALLTRPASPTCPGQQEFRKKHPPVEGNPHAARSPAQNVTAAADAGLSPGAGGGPARARHGQ